MTMLPKATVRKIIKQFYPDDRISSKAVDRLLIVAEDFIRMTYLDARKFADASNRKTVSEKDLILATT